MARNDVQRAGCDDDIRAVYEEYTVDDERVATIVDPENEHAWVRSDRTVPIQD